MNGSVYTAGQLVSDSGIKGYNTASSGTGVYGDGGNSGNSIGVKGIGQSSGVWGSSSTNGVYGTSPAGTGVFGNSSSGFGVYCSGSKCGGTKAWTNTSDARLKTNVVTISDALQKILSLRGVTYNWKVEPNAEKEMGFIAQEVDKIAPELVSQDNDGIYTMQASQITALLVEAIKEQQKQIENLKSRIAELEK